jgi:hypothetical protein
MIKNTLEAAIDIHLSRGINIGCEVFQWWVAQEPRLRNLTGQELDDEEWIIRQEMSELPAWKAIQVSGAFDALVSIPRPQIEPRKTQVELMYINKLIEKYDDDPRVRSLLRNLIGRDNARPGFLSNESLQVLLDFDANVMSV